MTLVRTVPELDRTLAHAREHGARIGLVITGGGLHAGHLSLVERAAARADVTVVAIAVASPVADPRRLERDLALCRARGVDAVFAPDPRLEAAPTDLGALLDVVRPDLVVLGRKDLDRVALARRTVADRGLGVEIDVAPIVREADGLAVGKANAFLSAPERRQAVGLVRGLEAARRAYRTGERRASRLEASVRAEVLSRPLLALEHVEIVRVADLEAVDTAGPGCAVVGVARCGRARLIDNLLLDGPP